MASGHGKNWSDPEGGTIKASVARHQLRADDGTVASLRSAEEVRGWCEEKMTWPKDSIIQKKGDGILRRYFFFVPAAGPGSVNRNIPKAETVKGVRAIHQANDVGQRGVLYVREGACFECSTCTSTDDQSCPNKEMCGRLQRREITSAAMVGRNVATRGMLHDIQQRLLGQLKPGDLFAVSPDEADTDTAFLLYLLHPADAPAPNLLRGQLLRPVSPGSLVYTRTDDYDQVPAARLLGQVDYEPVDVTYATRSRNEDRINFRIDGDDRSRALRMRDVRSGNEVLDW